MYLIILSTPAFLTAVIVLLWLDDAPRYQILMGDLELGLEKLENMIEENGVKLEEDGEFQDWKSKVRKWASRLRNAEVF